MGGGGGGAGGYWRGMRRKSTVEPLVKIDAGDGVKNRSRTKTVTRGKEKEKEGRS